MPCIAPVACRSLHGPSDAEAPAMTQAGVVRSAATATSQPYPAGGLVTAGGVMEGAAPISDHQLLAVLPAEIAAVADIGAGRRERPPVTGLVVGPRPRRAI